MVAQLSDHLEPWHSLAGKVVMVTGASSGLGRDFCLDLSRAGCRIVVAARRVDRLETLCREINRMAPPGEAAGGDQICRAVAVELDVVADGAVIDRYVKKAWDAFGHIDALINNAGVRGSVKSPLKLSEEEWDHVFKTNLTGCWLVSKYVCKRMCDARIKGSIINISSTAGLNRGQLPGAVAYASSKAGVNMLTKGYETYLTKIEDDDCPMWKRVDAQLCCIIRVTITHPFEMSFAFTKPIELFGHKLNNSLQQLLCASTSVPSNYSCS